MYYRLNSTLLYSALFSGLGVFSYLLLVNHTGLGIQVTDALHSVGAFFFFIAAFNILGHATIRLTSWINSQYSRTLPHSWKFISIYLLVMLMFFLLNYGLLVTAKLIVRASHPFLFPNGGVRLLVLVWLVELVVLGLLLANRSMRQTLKLQRKAAALQKETNTARYTALQNQLNPHFLFNSLNTLISEIRYNPQNAERFTQHLSDVYRYTLQCQEQRMASLRDELSFLRSYLFLHQVRLGDCIHLDNRIPAALQEMRIPPLTLQLLVENVIKHNTIHTGKPMTIELFCPEQSSVAHAEVRHELIMRTPIRPKKCVAPSGRGLKNLSARYLLLCQRDITIVNDHEFFTVIIPLLNE